MPGVSTVCSATRQSSVSSDRSPFTSRHRHPPGRSSRQSADGARYGVGRPGGVTSWTEASRKAATSCGRAGPQLIQQAAVIPRRRDRLG